MFTDKSASLDRDILKSHGPDKLELTNISDLKMSQMNRNVRFLEVHGTMTTLPRNIYMLSELQELHLKNNLIETLPEDLSRMTRLRILSLSHNKLRLLPDELG